LQPHIYHIYTNGFHDTVDVATSLVVPVRKTLEIAPGTVVRLAEGAGLTVYGTLNVEGTQLDPVVFRAASPTEIWNGIYVNGGSINMEWVEMYDTRNWCVFTDYPAGQDTPVVLKNCYFKGGAQGDGLRLWGSPSLMQKVENCVVDLDGVPIGDGLYLYNCKVDFDSVAVRNCSHVNSYVKKVFGISPSPLT